MKKIVKFLPLLLLVAALTVIFALNASATGDEIPVKQFSFYEYQGSGKGSVYNAAFKAAHDADYSFYGTDGTKVSAAGFSGVVNAVRTWVADKEVDDEGRVVIRDGSNNITEYQEIWVYYNGDASVAGGLSAAIAGTDRSANSSLSNSTTSNAASRLCKGSNGKLATVHVSPLAEDGHLNIYLNSKSTEGTVWTLDNNFHFKNVSVKVLRATSVDTYLNVCLLGFGTSLYMDEGSEMIAYKGSDTTLADTKAITLYAGGTTNAPDTSVKITILSGDWDKICYLAGLRNNLIGDCYFTFGGTATAGILSGTGTSISTIYAYNGEGNNSKLRGYTGSEANIIANSHVHITGGTLASFRGVFGWDDSSAPLTMQGNVTVVVEGTPNIATQNIASGSAESVCLTSRYGTVKGRVSVEVKGGTFFNDTSNDYDLYIAGLSGCAIEGNVTASVSGGTVKSKNSRLRAGNGSLVGDMTLNVSGSFSCTTVYTGFSTMMDGDVVANISGGTIGNFYGAGSSMGTADAHDTLDGNVTLNFSGTPNITTNIFGGGNYVDVTGDITINVNNATLGVSTFSAGPRQGGIISGNITVNLNGVNFTKATFHGVRAKGNTYELTMASGKKAAVKIDLVDDVVLTEKIIDADEVTLKGGAGKLVLSEAAAPLTVDSVQNNPAVQITDATVGKVYLNVPAGTNESDVTFTVTGDGTIAFANQQYFGFSVQPAANTVIMEDDFSMRYLFDKKSMDADGVTQVQYSTDGTNWNTASLVSYNSDYYSIMVDGIAAKNIADTVYVKSAASEQVDQYSIAQALVSVIADNGAAYAAANPSLSAEKVAQFVTLSKALLNYGAAAKTNFDYTGGAVIATYDDVPAAASYSDTSSKGDATGKTVKIVGTSLLAKDAISVKFIIDIGEENVADLTVKVNGVDSAMTQNGKYYTVSYEVPAVEMRDDATVEAWKSGAVVSNTYVDSISSYCAYVRDNSTDANLKALCEAIMEFVDAAIAYLG